MRDRVYSHIEIKYTYVNIDRQIIINRFFYLECQSSIIKDMAGTAAVGQPI